MSHKYFFTKLWVSSIQFVSYFSVNFEVSAHAWLWTYPPTSHHRLVAESIWVKTVRCKMKKMDLPGKIVLNESATVIHVCTRL